jgi:S1-C subfamily serine protease
LFGTVEAVDEENDLALIFPRILEVGERHVVPDGLVVPRKSTIRETDNLFVFGFPLGSQLGNEISIRPTRVIALRRDKDDKTKLTRIDVEGGMTFGNSGGPVVDLKGNVVGVAVAGLKDENIKFAVPAEKVVELLAKKRN